MNDIKSLLISNFESVILNFIVNNEMLMIRDARIGTHEEWYEMLQEGFDINCFWDFYPR